MIPIFELCLYSLPFHQKKKKKKHFTAPAPAVATNVTSTAYSTIVYAYPIKNKENYQTHIQTCHFAPTSRLLAFNLPELYLPVSLCLASL